MSKSTAVAVKDPDPTRHFCRQCRCKLQAVASDATGFCSRDCHRRYYIGRCTVCEKEKSKNTKTPFCSELCRRQAKKNPALVRRYRASDPPQTPQDTTPKPWFRSPPTAPVTPDAKSPCAAITFLSDFCPRGWQWAVLCDGLELELRIRDQRGRSFVVFDGTEWVIKHPRTYPHPLAFKGRDDALKAAVSLAAACLPLDLSLIKRERDYRKQVEAHLLKAPRVQ